VENATRSGYSLRRAAPSQFHTISRVCDLLIKGMGSFFLLDFTEDLEDN
jgi:hypothetical protein